MNGVTAVGDAARSRLCALLAAGAVAAWLLVGCAEPNYGIAEDEVVAPRTKTDGGGVVETAEPEAGVVAPPDGGPSVAVDAGGPAVTVVPVTETGDCVVVQCPAAAPFPVGCSFELSGSDPRGCVAHSPGTSTVFIKEGNDCSAGKVRGKLLCSTVRGLGLSTANCTVNKKDVRFVDQKSECPH